MLVYDPRTQRVEAWGLEVQGLPWLHREFEATMGSETLSRKGREGLGKWLIAKVKVLACDPKFELGAPTVKARHKAKAPVTSALSRGDGEWR